MRAPARRHHAATGATGATAGGDDAPPYGARLRLRADDPLETLPNERARVVARALQRDGMLLADAGNVALTPTSRWWRAGRASPGTGSACATPDGAPLWDTRNLSGSDEDGLASRWIGGRMRKVQAAVLVCVVAACTGNDGIEDDTDAGTGNVDNGASTGGVTESGSSTSLALTSSAAGSSAGVGSTSGGASGSNTSGTSSGGLASSGGSSGGIPYGNLLWMGLDGDETGPGDDGNADGTPDGHFRLTLDLPEAVEVQGIRLASAYSNGVEDGASTWDTGDDQHWVLVVQRAGEALNTGHVESLGSFADTNILDLYASSQETFTPGRYFVARVQLGDGEALSYRGRIPPGSSTSTSTGTATTSTSTGGSGNTTGGGSTTGGAGASSSTSSSSSTGGVSTSWTWSSSTDVETSTSTSTGGWTSSFSYPPETSSTSLPYTSSTSIPVTSSTSIPFTSSTSLPVTSSTSLPDTSTTSLPDTSTTSNPTSTSTSTSTTTTTSSPTTTSTSTSTTTTTSSPTTTSTSTSTTTTTTGPTPTSLSGPFPPP